MKTVSIYNFLHAFISVCGGFCSYWLGGYDLLLKTVLCLTVLDFITGTGQAIYNKTFTACACAKGTIKKVFIYLTVALSVIVGHFIGDNIPIREIVITFYIVSEGMSTLENIGKVIDYPAKLKEIFQSLNE